MLFYVELACLIVSMVNFLFVQMSYSYFFFFFFFYFLLSFKVKKNTAFVLLKGFSALSVFILFILICPFFWPYFLLAMFYPTIPILFCLLPCPLPSSVSCPLLTLLPCLLPTLPILLVLPVLPVLLCSAQSWWLYSVPCPFLPCPVLSHLIYQKTNDYEVWNKQCQYRVLRKSSNE